MIIGTCGFSGGRNGIVGLRTNVKTVPSTSLRPRWVEHTPRNEPSRPRAGSSSTPTVMAQWSVADGAEEIE